MTYEELLAENIRLRTRIRELEQENARLKGSGSSLLCEPEPPQYGSGPVRLERDRNTEIQRRLDIFRGLFRGREDVFAQRFVSKAGKVVAVADDFSIVVHSVVNDMDVLMWLFAVPDNGVLGVCDSHTLHILLGDSHHIGVGQFGRVLRVKGEHDAPYRFFYAGIQRLGLRPERPADIVGVCGKVAIFVNLQRHSFRVQKTRVLAVLFSLIQVIFGAASEAGAFSKFCYHFFVI